MTSTLRPTTIISAIVGVSVVSFLGYAVYFDHRRRTDVEFRRALKRDAKKESRIARTKAEANANAQKGAIQAAVEQAKAEGFPKDNQEKESYFMEQVSQGEVLSQSPDTEIEAALCFYKALKVYPTPSDLVNIYDQTVSKPVLDILAEMVAYDPSLSIRGTTRKSSPGGSSNESFHGIDD